MRIKWFIRTRRHVAYTLFNIENENDRLETVELMFIISVVSPRCDNELKPAEYKS